MVTRASTAWPSLLRRKFHQPCVAVHRHSSQAPSLMAPLECAFVQNDRHTVGQLFEDFGVAEVAGAAAGDEGDRPNRGRLYASEPMPAPGPRYSPSSPQLPLSFGEIAAAATTPPPRQSTSPVFATAAANSCVSNKKAKPPR